MAGPKREKTYSLGEVGDEVVPVLCLLETGESHLGSGNVLSSQRCPAWEFRSWYLLGLVGDRIVRR